MEIKKRRSQDYVQAIILNKAFENSTRQMVQAVHKNAVNHGWYDESRTFGELIALCHCELSEALEEYRKGKGYNEIYNSENGKYEGIGVELADVVIRIFDLCGHLNIDIARMITLKHEFNKTRPYKHGGKVI